MKPWVLALSFWFAACSIAPARSAAEDSIPSARWRSLHASFESDDGTFAQGARATGRVGRSVLLGRSALPPQTARRGVVDLSRPGAITCWVRPDRWRPASADSEYVPALRVTGSGPAALVVQRDRRLPGREGDVWVAGFFSVDGFGDTYHAVELSTWDDVGWRFLAFQWDAVGFSIQVADVPPARVAYPVFQASRSFPRSSSALVLGAATIEGLRVDELSVWTRNLTASEVAALQREGSRP